MKNDGSHSLLGDSMITKYSRLSVFSCLLMLSLTGCGGGGSSSTGTTNPPANLVPTANAGDDQTVNELEKVTLNGSASRDSDGSITSYQWSQVAGPNVTLDLTDPVMPTFTAPDIDEKQTLTFELVVVDNDGSASEKDTVNINVLAIDTPPGVIERTGDVVSVGVITGFGSVLVNGVSYETESSDFFRNGALSSIEHFGIGESVMIKGTIDNNNANAAASTVELTNIIEGPVSNINDFGVISVLGAAVETNLNTLIDRGCPSELDNSNIASLAILGNYSSLGTITATHILCKELAQVDAYRFSGQVSDFDQSNMTFKLNNLLVDYTQATIDPKLTSGNSMLANGVVVEVKGSPTSFKDEQLPSINATDLIYLGDSLKGNEGDHYQVDGFITNYSSAEAFNLFVGPHILPITTTENTQFLTGTKESLGNAIKVEVEGEINASGVLQATKLIFEPAIEINVLGSVDDVSAENKFVKIFDITINTDPLETQFIDETTAQSPSFNLGDIKLGDVIEARASMTADGELNAVRIERTMSEKALLRGYTKASSVVIEPTATGYREGFSILDVKVDAKNVETYKDRNNNLITAEEFWAIVELGAALALGEGSELGYLIIAKGAEGDANLFIATELQLKAE